MAEVPEPSDARVDPAVAEVHALSDLVTPMAVRVAATLRLADHLAGGARTPQDLAGATGADASTLARLLAHLATVGLVRRAGDAYELTDTGAVLRDDDPGRLRGVLDLDGPLGRAELSFVHLLHSVRTGAPAFPEQYGADFWSDVIADPARAAAYDADMGRDVAAWAPAIIGAVDWGRLGSVVDVGGGAGVLLAALLEAFPTLRGTVLDRPGTADRAREHLASLGLADRGDAVGGTFFDALPAGAGGYLLTAILHDWPDEPATRILRRCAEAATPAGRVFVIEKIGADGTTPNTAMDLRLLAYMAGVERPVDELVALGEAAGLRPVAVHRAGAIVVLEMAPA